jgi:hypothetical protein
MDTHTLIGQVTDVPSTNTCRIDVKAVGQAPLIHHALKHRLSRRRPANIAQTDEKHAVFPVFNHFEGAILQKNTEN